MGAGLAVILSGAAALTGLLAQVGPEIINLVTLGAGILAIVDAEAAEAVVTLTEGAVWAAEFFNPPLKFAKLLVDNGPAPKRLKRE